MNKTLKIYIVLFVIVVGVMALLEAGKTPVTDWRKNFDPNKKTPFGLYVFDQEAHHFINNLQRIAQSPYDYYSNNKKTENHNILLITNDFDDVSIEKILDEVEKGSDLMWLINDRIPYNLADSLGISVTNWYYSNKDTLLLDFTDVKLRDVSLEMSKSPDYVQIGYARKETEILGITNDASANFVRISHGKGNVYIHTKPLILTNYYLLNTDADKYVQHVFSYLPNDRKTHWFVPNYEFVSSSPLRFVLNNPPLKYAWWTFLAGLLLFTIFNAKRRQRIVPVIEPPANKSVEFVKSIGNFYLQEGNHQDMANKKVQYFLQKVRSEWLLDTQKWDDDFSKKLHIKTGIPLEKIQQTASLIEKLKIQPNIFTTNDLAELNRLLDEIIK